MTKEKEYEFIESIDEAIELLQKLKHQKHNNSAFIVTMAHDDPTDPSAVLVSCICNGPLTIQLNSLLEYINTDPRIMPALESYNQAN